MSEISLLHADERRAFKIGATRGQADIKPLITTLKNSRAEAPVVLNFDGIRAVNASYVRASVAWLIRSGMLARNGVKPSERDSDPIPLRISQVFVRNLASDVREEIDGLLRQPSFKLSCFEFVSPTRLRLLGHLDLALWQCLEALYQCGGEITALGLHRKRRSDGVQTTAWNNRLAALYARMLVDRRKEGRFWVYRTVSKQIEPYGIQVPA
jgi:hypothetical protein